ncbi:MAG: HlyD family efflux transporter periplasmic adaptor subunit [Rhodoferax sp.]|uniref:HlyD family secretion protein n=1 Tax=Rhodoferax sp. TaxID=50421 RepID=UPI0026185816|nr:HlyD family efflux transporter periplasmic adaptor subunit [Rhodoferax sp.]MDD5333741.1 HlyD family efflux transporter periplasmic adaptor subunit [Rhodoferax sp.]
MKLFRQEVHVAQAAQWLGSVRLHRPLSFTLVTTVALGMALALVAFAAWGEVNRKARLSGLLVPSQGSLNITAQQSGVLMELLITEGQTVQAGDVLLVLNTEHRSLLQGAVGDTSERAARQIEARRQTLSTEQTLRELQTRQREQVLADRIRTLQAELRQAEEERSLQQRRVQLARGTLARNEQLAAEGFVAPAQVQTRQEELIDADGRLQALERSRLALQHDLQALRGERTALSAQLESDLNLIERNRSSLDQEMSENAARKSTVITAPYAGTVTALNLTVGQSVQTGQTLATLVPQAATGSGGASKGAALQAHLFAPSRTAGFVRPGQSVYLRYAAYPYQKFGLYTGHITAVSATPFAPSELPSNLSQQLIAQVGSSEALYRINVQLDAQDIKAYGETMPLKPGLTLEADVLQERRKVWEWVLEPVLAARQQMWVLNADPNKGRAGG